MLSVSGVTLAGPINTPGVTRTNNLIVPGEGTGPTTRTVVGLTTFNGHAVTELHSTIGLGTDTDYIGTDASGNIVEYGSASTTTTLGDDNDTYDPDQLVLPASMTAGVAFEQTDTDTDVHTDSDGNNPSTNETDEDFTITLVSETPQSHTVPSGTYMAYELHQVQVTSDPDDDTDTDTDSANVWVVPGIGIIELDDADGVSEVLTSITGLGEHLDFTQPPKDTDKSKTLDPITVSAKDKDGNVDTTATGSVTLSLNTIEGEGALTGTLTQPLVDGVATFNDLQIDGSGTYTLSATDSGTPQADSATSGQFKIGVSALTWTGGGDGLNWSDPKNWDADVKPENGDNLLFPDGSPLHSNNDLTGLSLASIDIQGSGYTLTGNAISLTDSLTSEAGNNTYNIDTTLVGSPEIDDQTGDLDIKSVFSGDSVTLGGNGEITFDDAATYTGDTTLQAGVTIDDDVLTDALGSGDITIGTGAKPVTIDAGVGGGVATINNDITFQDGSTLATDPEVVLGGTVTVNGQDSLSPTGVNDQITLNADDIAGSGTLLIKGGGKVSIKGSLIASVQVMVLSGELDFDGKLLGSVSGTNQIVMKGGTVKVTTLGGNGGIDLVSGNFIAGDASSASGYGGTITLEQSPSGQAGPTLTLGSGTGVGSGQIVVLGPPLLTSNVPLIDASSATSGITLDNTLVMKDSSIMNVAGNVTFSQQVSVDPGVTAEINMVSKTDSLTLNGGAATSLTGIATLGLDGPGTVTVAGTIALGMTLSYGAALTDTSGLLVLSASLGGSLGGNQDFVVLNGGKTRLVGVSGNGDIDVVAGSLLAGTATDYHGSITLEQSAASKPAATLVVGNLTGIGDGALIVATPTSSDNNTPVIDATSATSGASLDATLILRNGAVVKITGNITFTQAVQANGSSAEIDTVSNGDKVTLAGGITDTPTNSPTVTLDGPGLLTLGGKISLGVALAYGAKLAGGSGELDLGTNLGGDLAQITFSAGQLDVEGGKVRFTGLSGTGGIDLKGGALLAGTVDGYDGAIRLFQTASGDPGVVIVLQDGTSLGGGSIDATSPTAAGGSVPLIDASLVTSNLTLANALYLEDGAALKITGNVTFSGTVTANGATASINSTSSSDKLTFQGGITSGLTNTPTLSIDGPGTVTLGGAISFPVTINYGASNTGTTGQLIVGADLGGSLSIGATKNNSQIVVQGGTVTLSGVSNNGGIELQSGTLVAGTVSGYTGQITLDAALLGQSAPSLKIGDNASFGTGKLVISTPGIFAGSAPLLDASSATSTVTIDNSLTLQDGAILNVSGNVTFSQVVTTNGSTAGMNTIASGNKLTLAGGITIGTLTTTTVSLDGPGTITLGGTGFLGTTVNFGAKLAGLSGLLILSRQPRWHTGYVVLHGTNRDPRRQRKTLRRFRLGRNRRQERRPAIRRRQRLQRADYADPGRQRTDGRVDLHSGRRDARHRHDRCPQSRGNGQRAADRCLPRHQRRHAQQFARPAERSDPHRQR